MPKKKTKDVRKAIERYVTRWIKVFGLQNWEIKIRYLNYIRMAPNGFNVLMETECSWSSLQAVIYVYLPALVDAPGEIEKTVVHELLHIVVDEAKEKNGKHTERVCELLATAFMRLKNK